VKRALFVGGPRGDEARDVADNLPERLILAIPPRVDLAEPLGEDGSQPAYLEKTPFETYERVNIPAAQLALRGFDACYRYR